MSIETKYHIGDEVWFMWGNKAQKSQVYDVAYTFICADFELEMPQCRIDYKVVLASGVLIRMPESCIFPTKEELLKSL